jgi:hypothetical protein
MSVTLTTRRPPSALAEPEPNSSNPDSAWLALVAEKARTMQYGVIQIVVHDSRVVQIERTERTRFEVPRHHPSAA